MRSMLGKRDHTRGSWIGAQGFSTGDPNLAIGRADIVYFAKSQTLLLPESGEKMGASPRSLDYPHVALGAG